MTASASVGFVSSWARKSRVRREFSSLIDANPGVSINVTCLRVEAGHWMSSHDTSRSDRSPSLMSSAPVSRVKVSSCWPPDGSLAATR